MNRPQRGLPYVPAPNGGFVMTTAPSGGLPEATPYGGGASLIGHYVMKPRPLAVDAFRLCRSSVNNVCKRMESVAVRMASEYERLMIPETRWKLFPPPVFENVVTESGIKRQGA